MLFILVADRSSAFVERTVVARQRSPDLDRRSPPTVAAENKSLPMSTVVTQLPSPSQSSVQPIAIPSPSSAMEQTGRKSPPLIADSPITPPIPTPVIEKTNRPSIEREMKVETPKKEITRECTSCSNLLQFSQTISNKMLIENFPECRDISELLLFSWWNYSVGHRPILPVLCGRSGDRMFNCKMLCTCVRELAIVKFG